MDTLTRAALYPNRTPSTAGALHIGGIYPCTLPHATPHSCLCPFLLSPIPSLPPAIPSTSPSPSVSPYSHSVCLLSVILLLYLLLHMADGVISKQRLNTQHTYLAACVRPPGSPRTMVAGTAPLGVLNGVPSGPSMPGRFSTIPCLNISLAWTAANHARNHRLHYAARYMRWHHLLLPEPPVARVP